ncbi:MAG TPA: deoxyhypusine synthase family protein [Terriglobales bacterium]|nr:deoxyhypusine synthase family protein [Terriglobales bacterium]
MPDRPSIQVPGAGEVDARAKAEYLHTRVRPVDFDQVSTVADLVGAMRGASIQARNLGLCAEVLDNLYADPDRPTVLLGLAGPLIAAGLRKVLRDLVAGGFVDVIVSTGAILYQDIYQARGFGHYAGDPNANDAELRDLLIDRIYDTYVDEEKFMETDTWLGYIADELPPGNYSSRAYMEFVGGKLDDDQSIVATAARRGVPMFVPALNDSSIGIGLTHHYHRATKAGKPKIAIDSIRDNYELTQIVVQSKKTAALYIAGGVPKNYINDSVVMAYIFEEEKGHSYALQLTTDVPHWGGLSGSTLKEAMSWGKIQPKATTAMCFVEPSVSLPLLAGYAFQRKLAAGRPKLHLTWENDILRELRRG